MTRVTRWFLFLDFPSKYIYSTMERGFEKDIILMKTAFLRVNVPVAATRLSKLRPISAVSESGH